jgi:hypothetical protein
MSRDMIGGVILAAGVWIAFGYAMVGASPMTPRGYAWVVTGSEKVASRPELVRVNMPIQIATAAD